MKTNKFHDRIEDTISNTIETYNFLAKAYAAEWSSKPDLELANYFIECLDQGTQILDMGCGPGHYTQLFSEAGFDVTGIDLSDGMLEQARVRLATEQFKKMDMRNLEFADESFGALWICASSPHIPEQAMVQALLEWRRVLKKGGVLFINAIIGDTPYRLELPGEIDEAFRVPGRFFQWYVSQAAFEHLLEKAGFSIFHVICKMIHSNVLQKANHRVNYWVNYYCRLAD